MSNLAIIKETIPGEKHSVAEDLARTVKHVSNHQCAKIVPSGLIIHPDATIESWRWLLKELHSMSHAGEIRGVLLKFYVGDALNQGADLFGESHAQVYGSDIKWSMGYINNITWVCRKIPPENRCIKLNSWRMHQDLASLSHEEQRYYVKIALEKYEKDEPGWYKQMRDMIQDDKCRDLIRTIAQEDRDKWVATVEEHRPSWTQLEKWINGEEPTPAPTMEAHEWVIRRIEGEKVRGAITDDQYEILKSAMFDLIDGIREKAVRV